MTCEGRVARQTKEYWNPDHPSGCPLRVLNQALGRVLKAGVSGERLRIFTVWVPVGVLTVEAQLKRLAWIFAIRKLHFIDLLSAGLALQSNQRCRGRS